MIQASHLLKKSTADAEIRLNRWEITLKSSWNFLKILFVVPCLPFSEDVNKQRAKSTIIIQLIVTGSKNTNYVSDNHITIWRYDDQQIILKLPHIPWFRFLFSMSFSHTRPLVSKRSKRLPVVRIGPVSNHLPGVKRCLVIVISLLLKPSAKNFSCRKRRMGCWLTPRKKGVKGGHNKKWGGWWLLKPRNIIYPWRWTAGTWRGGWKIMFLSKCVICRFHVNLPGCKNCCL